MDEYRPPDVAGYFYILFGKHPPKDHTLAEILADIYDRNPQIYDTLVHDLRKTNADKCY
tara:strand:- start:1774 stop:1950 length:177 start_codon:yes stop_codon:yes gene_type:complete